MFLRLMDRVAQHIQDWTVPDTRQMERVKTLRREFTELQAMVTRDWLADPQPWDRLSVASDRWSTEMQELLVAMVRHRSGGREFPLSQLL